MVDSRGLEPLAGDQRAAFFLAIHRDIETAAGRAVQKLWHGAPLAGALTVFSPNGGLSRDEHDAIEGSAEPQQVLAVRACKDNA